MLDLLTNGQVFRSHVIDVHLKAGETMHLSLLSDLHIDSSLCDYEGLKQLAAERRKLPNHGAIVVGDLCDLVMPPDLKRYRPTARTRELDGRDDFLSAAIENVIEKMKKLDLAWHLISPGNHEDAALKYHGVDATSVIAHALGAIRGAYYGFLDFRLRCGNKNSRGGYHEKRFRVAYCHGNWGPGHLSKGFLGANRFFSVLEDWDLAVSGHNHGCRVDPELRINVDPRTRGLRERQVYIINASSWTKPISPDARYPSYKEVKGYPPSGPRKSPLVRVSPRWTNHGAENSKSNSMLTLDVSIEV